VVDGAKTQVRQERVPSLIELGKGPFGMHWYVRISG
jgi:hypothetical protein